MSNLINREEKKHIDGFKYWCETNEENGTITIPKFVCDEIVKILDKFYSVRLSDAENHKCKDCYLYGSNSCTRCENMELYQSVYET